jgi:hypothetical protein
MVADLVHFVRCVVDTDNTTLIIIAFSFCRQTARCRTVALLLAKHVKRRIVVRRVVAMSLSFGLHIYREIVKTSISASDNVTSQPHVARQRAVWCASLTTRRQCDNAPFGALSCCR